MTTLQTRSITDLLTAWMSGTSLVDDLIPQTQALLNQLTTPHGAKRQILDTSQQCQTLDTSAMSGAELRAYYKRTAPVEDVRFQLRLSDLPADIRTGYESLLAVLQANRGKATNDTKREYARLMATWRSHMLTQERGGPADVRSCMPHYYADDERPYGVGGPYIILSGPNPNPKPKRHMGRIRQARRKAA